MNKYKCSKCGKEKVLNSKEEPLQLKCCDGENKIEHKLTGLVKNIPVAGIEIGSAPQNVPIKAKITMSPEDAAKHVAGQTPTPVPQQQGETKLDQASSGIKPVAPAVKK